MDTSAGVSGSVDDTGVWVAGGDGGVDEIVAVSIWEARADVDDEDDEPVAAVSGTRGCEGG